MAFVQLESFAVHAPAPWWADSDRMPVWPTIVWPDWLEWPLRRTVAATLSILIIATLCWMLLDRLSGPGTGGSGRGGSGLKMFTVSTAPPAEASVSKAVTPPQPIAAATADIDVSKSADLPAEWSVAKVRVAKEVGVSAVVQPPVLAGGGAVGGGGGGGYDPYAGASPHRNDISATGSAYAAGLAPGGASAGGGQTGAIALDPAVLDAARRAALRVQPGARGRVLLSVQLSASGTIVDVRLERSELDQAPLRALMRALLGARVQTAMGAAASFRLPEIVVG